MKIKAMNPLDDMVKVGRLTEMGRVIRLKRIEHRERLYDMAEKIGCTISFLSSFEVGDSFSDGIFERILQEYDFTKKERETMIADYISRTRRIPKFIDNIDLISELIASEVVGNEQNP